MIIKLVAIIILTINSHYIFSQIIDNSQARSDVKWEQIETKNYKLIFPKTYRKQATLLSYQMDQMRQVNSDDLNISPRKIPIIIHSNHIEQNGFVQLAPRKSEFFPIPSGISGNVEWLPNLALHEWRHVAQMDKLSGKLKAPFLEQLSFAFYGIHLPAWYFEGDAVSMETQFSTGGRGRLPSWFLPIRANELSGKNYTFDKNILGSFKDITPSFYTTGYLMNAHLTNQFGYEIKDKLLEDMRGHLLRPFNFYKALRKNTKGYNSKKLYLSTIDSLSKIWTEQYTKKESYEQIEVPYHKHFSHFYLPQYIGNELIALFHSPQQVPQIVSIKGDQKIRITFVGRQLMPYFDARDDIIIWDELRKDARFAKNTFNVINTYNTTTRKTKTLHFDWPIYTPALHPNKDFFAAIKVDKTGLTSLIICHLENGSIEKEIIMPRGMHIQQPQFNNNGNHIITVAVSEKGTNLLEFNLENNEYQTLLSWNNQQIARPIYHDDHIVYKAHYSGIDNIYQFDRHSGSIQALTDTKYGAFNPSIDNNGQLIFNDYAFDGNKIAKKELSSLYQIDLMNVNDLAYDNRLPEEHYHIQTDSTKQPIIKPYHSLSGFLNFHSLSISSSNFENFDNYKPGVFWLANDLLNTSQLRLGYEYDTDIRKSTYSAEINYSKYYPKFIVGYQNRGQTGQAIRRTNDNDSTINFDFREHYLSADIQLPFSVYRKNRIYSYGVNIGTSYHKRYDLSIATLQNFNEEIILPLNYQMYFNRNTLRSAMDLIPRWGQNLSIIYRHVPFESEMEGNILSVRTNFYFPGIMLNHGLQVRLNYQEKSGRYLHTNDIPVVSGFGYFKSAPIKNTLLFNYRMPIAYPDWTIGPLAYIKRIQGQLFADYQNLDDSSSLSPKTFGVGLSADLNIFRYSLPDINVGSRFIYINDRSASQRVVPTFSFSYSY